MEKDLCMLSTDTILGPEKFQVVLDGETAAEGGRELPRWLALRTQGRNVSRMRRAWLLGLL